MMFLPKVKMMLLAKAKTMLLPMVEIINCVEATHHLPKANIISEGYIIHAVNIIDEVNITCRRHTFSSRFQKGCQVTAHLYYIII